MNTQCFSIIQNYKAVEKKELIYNKSVSEKVQKLSLLIEQAGDENEISKIVTDFYKTYGVGKFGLNKAFSISSGTGADCLVPITTTSDVTLNDLVGIRKRG